MNESRRFATDEKMKIVLEGLSGTIQQMTEFLKTDKKRLLITVVFELLQESLIILVIKLKDHASHVTTVKTSVFPGDVTHIKIDML